MWGLTTFWTLQIVGGMQNSKTAACVKTPKTEAELRRSDQRQHAFRYVGSSLSAGHPFTFRYRTSPKAQCLKDFQTLFGNSYDMSSFPVKGGRQVIAGQCLYLYLSVPDCLLLYT